MAMMFFAGAVISGMMTAMVTYAYLKGKYEGKVTESYNKGYAAGREIEKRAIFDYIERLNNDPNTCVYNAESPKGSEN